MEEENFDSNSSQYVVKIYQFSGVLDVQESELPYIPSNWNKKFIVSALHV